MKTIKQVLLICIAAFLCLSVHAQAPQKFNYQAVARNNNVLLPNTNVGIRLTITQGNGGTSLYQETQTPLTNVFGIFSLQVGGGTVVSGNFSAINWQTGDKWLHVEMDPSGGVSYTDMGASELLSVPYSLFAASGNQGPTGLPGDRYSTTSSTSLAIGMGTQSFTVDTSLNYSVGQSIIIANSITDMMHGTLVSYNYLTGAMVVDVTSINGTGTFSFWSVSLDGAPGPAGATGLTGPPGPAGPQGIQGLTGIGGPVGATGDNGATWYTGAGSPSSGTGVLNDLYLNTSNGDYFVKTSSTLWTQTGNLQGPQGLTGSTGLQGPQGLTGATGTTGAQGPQGTQGIQGIAGPQGPIGLQGPQGGAGATGTAGLNGDRYTTTSSSNLAIATGNISLTVGTGLNYALGQTVIIANSVSNMMTGTIVSYTSGNGNMNVDITSVAGSGSFSSWSVSLNGAEGPAGPAGPAGSANITGDNNYIVKFTGTTSGANSQIYDDGTSVGIGNQGNVDLKLWVSGRIAPDWGAGNDATYRFGDGSENTGFGSPNVNEISVVNGGTETMHISGNNFVGINNNAPVVPLDVNGDVALNDHGLMLRDGGDPNHYLKYDSGVDGPTLAGYNGGALIGGTTTCLNWKSDGKVGVGTSNPDALFTVKGSGSYAGNHIALFENTDGVNADGIAIKIDNALTNKENNFVTFYNANGDVKGRIEGFNLATDVWTAPAITIPNMTLNYNFNRGRMPYYSWHQNYVNFGNLDFAFPQANVDLHCADFWGYTPSVTVSAPGHGSASFCIPDLYSPSIWLNTSSRSYSTGFDSGWREDSSAVYPSLTIPGSPLTVNLPDSNQLQNLACYFNDHGMPFLLSADPLTQATALLKQHVILACNDGGVTYGSHGADYAEYIEKADHAEYIQAFDVVGIKGGRVSRNTEGAEQVMIVSSKPVVLGNTPKEGEEKNFVTCGFMGQLPCVVRGLCHKGDYILASNLNDGSAVAIAPDHLTVDMLDRIVGRAWDDQTNEIYGLVNVAIGLKTNEWVSIFKNQEKKMNDLSADIDMLKSALGIKNETSGTNASASVNK